MKRCNVCSSMRIKKVYMNGWRVWDCKDCGFNTPIYRGIYIDTSSGSMIIELPVVSEPLEDVEKVINFKFPFGYEAWLVKHDKKVII